MLKYVEKQYTSVELDYDIFENIDEVRVPVELSDFSDIIVDFRKGKNVRSELIVRKTLGDGVSISENTLQIEHSFQEPGTVYFDVYFKQNDVYYSYIEGEILIVENITEI